MAARDNPLVNLLPSDRFEYSRVGRFLQWALSTGRHVLMLTELVVIIAFLSRFWFDRSLENLREVRIQKEAIVDSYDDVLDAFLRVQSQVSSIRRILRVQSTISNAFVTIQSRTPQGVSFDEITASSQSATFKGFASSSTTLSTFLSNLQTTPQFDTVSVKSLQLSKDRSPGFDFEVQVTEKTP